MGPCLKCEFQGFDRTKLHDFSVDFESGADGMHQPFLLDRPGRYTMLQNTRDLGRTVCWELQNATEHEESEGDGIAQIFLPDDIWSRRILQKATLKENELWGEERDGGRLRRKT